MASASSVSFDLEPREITVGDQIEMVLRLRAPADASIIWPGPEQLSPAEIISMDTLRPAGDERSVRYILSVFETGRIDLPDLPILISQEDAVDTVWVDPGTVEVISVLEPADSLADIRDVHPPVALALTFKEILPYLIVVLAVLILATAAYLMWRKWRKKRGEIPEWTPPPRPAHETALRRLEDLRLKRLWQNGYSKEFHSELTEIIKEYIGDRFEFIAPEMTTEDLFACRKRWSSDEESFLLVRRILTCADLVKFARFKPDPRENDRCLDSGFQYVEATQKREETINITDHVEKLIQPADGD